MEAAGFTSAQLQKHSLALAEIAFHLAAGPDVLLEY